MPVRATPFWKHFCGSGRFFLPFFERGFDIQGMDASPDMLAKLRKKCPNAPAVCADIAAYTPDRAYDYIFISSGSVSLFTDLALCRRILAQLKSWLAPGGKLVFAVETVADRCPDDTDYREAVAVPCRVAADRAPHQESLRPRDADAILPRVL
ncbi:MAG: class I SAM-dependent methyltransferase [Christensenellaceae bacterium]